MSTTNQRTGPRISINTLINWGATVVIIGLMFKILHWEGGELAIAIGLSTEACLFALLGFQTLRDEKEQKSVTPMVTQQRGPLNTDLDELLSKSLNHQTIDRLNKGFEQFNKTVETVNDIAKVGSAGITNAMVKELEGAANELKVLRANLAAVNSLDTANLTKGLSQEFQQSTTELKNLRTNLADLNNVYKAQLDAFRKA